MRWLHTRGVCMSCRGFMTEGVCEHYYSAISHVGYVDRSSPWKADLRRKVRIRRRAPLVTKGKPVRRGSAPMPYESPDAKDAKIAESIEMPGDGEHGQPEVESGEAEECPSGPASSSIGRSKAASYRRLGDATLLNAPLCLACIVRGQVLKRVCLNPHCVLCNAFHCLQNKQKMWYGSVNFIRLCVHLTCLGLPEACKILEEVEQAKPW